MSNPKLVRDLMTVGVPTCPLNTDLNDLLLLMLKKNWEAVVVLDEIGHAAGFVGQPQLIQAFAHEKYTDLTAEDIMELEIPTAPADIPIQAAAHIMLDAGIRVLYMTHHAGGIEYPAAWLTYEHLLRFMSGDEMKDTGIRAEREAPLDVFLRRREEALKKVVNKSASGQKGDV